MYVLSERLFLSTVREAYVKKVLIEYGSIAQSHFCCFIDFEQLNTHTSMRQNARICKYPHKHSYLGVK